MADAAQSLPRGGQRGFGRAWPEYIGLYVPQTSVSDVGHRPARFRAWKRHGPGWSATKVQRSARIADFAEKMGMKDRTLRDHISKLCQRIADNLNQKHVVWLNNRVDNVSKILAYGPTESLPEEQPQRSPTHIMTTDAKPRSDLSAEAAKLVAREIEKLNRRNRGRRRA
jgi:hypothetical protein